MEVGSLEKGSWGQAEREKRQWWFGRDCVRSKEGKMLASGCVVVLLSALSVAYRSPITYNPPFQGLTLSNHSFPVAGIVKALVYAADYERRVYDDDRGLGRGEDDPSYWGNGVAAEEYNTQPKLTGDAGFFFSKVTEYLAKEYGYNAASAYNGGLRLVDFLELLPQKYARFCASFYQKCYVTKYRSFDGSCNNLRFPFYGQTGTVLGRIAIPRYEDGIHGGRMGVDGSPLPPARALRYAALPDKDVNEPSVNMLFVNFGQFITHDLVHSPFYQAQDGQFLDCCQGYQEGREEVHPKCMAISVNKDPFYSAHTHETCHNFARALLAPNYACTAGYASPMNLQTSYLDLSLTYGKSLNDSKDLRTFSDGLLKTTRIQNQELLLLDSKSECFNSSQGFCFKSGDPRTTIQPGMTLFQTLAARMHNLIVKELLRHSQKLDDETLFQEARRINIAFNQHLVYHEYLPILLGRAALNEYAILPPTEGYSRDYDDKGKGWIYAEFSGAAFRLHTSVYGKILLANEDFQVEESLPLQAFYNSAILYKEPKNFLKLLRGYVIAPQRKHDKYYDPAISNYLFKDTRPFGLDIGAMNIQRGRDYGLRSYNDYREICGLPRAASFDDFKDHLDLETIEDFRHLYRSADDVDLYAGGIAERHVAGTLLGPTHHCIVASQFQRLRLSDRFFYTHSNQPHTFTPGQLREIRKMTLPTFLCMTTELKYVPLYPFNTLSPSNPLVSCNDSSRIPSINFSLFWKSKATKYEL